MSVSRSRVSLEASELTDDGSSWTEAYASIERDDEPDEDLRFQGLCMTRAEMDALYARMRLYYEQGIWSTGAVA